MNKKQIKIAARLLAVYFLDKAVDDEPSELFIERAEKRLTRPELKAIDDELTDISQDLLGKDVRCGTVKEIIEYARKS